MKTKTKWAAVASTGTLLSQKTELATEATDMLLFGGEVGGMIQTMAGMAGIPKVSVSLIFPTKRPDNTRPFLTSLNSIITAALDDQVELERFTHTLAEHIRVIQAIAAEEKA